MATTRDLGGLPLAVYVFALLLIPFTAVGVFSVREVERNEIEARGALAVVDAADVDVRVAAVFVPLEVERTAAAGLARIDELGISRDTAKLATGLDLDGLRNDNYERLDVALSDLREVIEAPQAIRRHDTVVASLANVRERLADRSLALEEVTGIFDAAQAHVSSLRSSSDVMIGEYAASSVDASGALQRLELILDVVDSARREMGGFSTVVLASSGEGAIELIAGGARHVDALDAAEREFLTPIAALRAEHANLPDLPVLAFTNEVAPETGFTTAEMLQVTQGLFSHLEYLNSVADFAAEQSGWVRAEIEASSEAALERNRITMLGLAALAVFTLLFATVVTVSFVRPLARLRQQAEKISGGELHADSLMVGGPTDIRKVTRAVNEMAGTLSLVEDHMEALARADLTVAGSESEQLIELPGHVGSSMRSSMDRVRALTARLQASESRLAEQARLDNLTELPNRFAVFEYLDRLLGQGCAVSGKDTADAAPVTGSSETTGVMFLDVDGFKTVNDTHGHAAGDMVLREIAHRLGRSIRNIDYVARLGGDEFIVVVADIGDAQRLASFGERLIREVEQPYQLGDQLFVVSASIGVTMIESGDDATAVIERADAAVYQAKRRGRRRVEMFDKELQGLIEQEAALELSLRQAIQRDELRMYLQPLADLATGMPSGAEALVRWERPGVGLVPPGEFIPIAERSGLIFELERWVLHAACTRIAEWMAQGRGAGMRLAVNISGRHLIEGDLRTDLDLALAATGADPNLLELELTESQLLDDVERASRLLADIRALGVKIAIDDFGTGYSSMTYLQKLPVDIVKIDRSFIMSATTNEFDSTIIDTIVTIGRALDLEIVAEGIETVEQLDYVRNVGVTQGQGFLLARPNPVEVAEEVLFGGSLLAAIDVPLAQPLN